LGNCKVQQLKAPSTEVLANMLSTLCAVVHGVNALAAGVVIRSWEHAIVGSVLCQFEVLLGI